MEYMSGCRRRMLLLIALSLKGRGNEVIISVPTRRARLKMIEAGMPDQVQTSSVTAAITIARQVRALFCSEQKHYSSSRIDYAVTSRRTPFLRLAYREANCHSARCGAVVQAELERERGREAAERVFLWGEGTLEVDLKSSVRSLIAKLIQNRQLYSGIRVVAGSGGDITIKSNKFQFYSGKMMQRIPFGSPTKENIQASPSRKRKGDLIPELQAFLKNAGISLPRHLAPLLSSNPESPAKANDEAKRLKVQLSECEFELKKVEEDFAEFKRVTKLEREKEAKRNQEQVSKLKNCLESSSENSAYKLEKVIAEHQAEKKALKEKQRLQLQQEVAKVKQTLLAKLESEQKLKKREINELVHAHNTKLAEIAKIHRQTLAALQERAEKELAQTKARHKAVLQDKQRRHESVRVALQSQRKTQQKLHEKTKLDAIKQREKLVCELCFQRNTRTQLEEEAVSREKIIKQLKSTINDLNVDLQLLDQKSRKKAQEMKEQYEAKHQQAVKAYQESLKKVKQVHAEELQKFEQRLAKMEKTHQQKVQLLAQGTQELAGSFDRRPSKPQDLSEIERLKWALAKKEEEARKLSRDLKHCNLQLQNKEETYTRIFRGNSMSREKRSAPKEDRQKQQLCVEERLGKEAIFRKSQTADVKYLLKIYNNTKNG